MNSYIRYVNVKNTETKNATLYNSWNIKFVRSRIVDWKMQFPDFVEKPIVPDSIK